MLHKLSLSYSNISLFFISSPSQSQNLTSLQIGLLTPCIQLQGFQATSLCCSINFICTIYYSWKSRLNYWFYYFIFILNLRVGDAKPLGYNDLGTPRYILWQETSNRINTLFTKTLRNSFLGTWIIGKRYIKLNKYHKRIYLCNSLFNFLIQQVKIVTLHLHILRSFFRRN